MRCSGSGVKGSMTMCAMATGALVLVLGTSSCAMMHGARAGRPGLQVVVGNDVRPARDVVVFLQRPNGVKLRLGTVESDSTRTLTYPSHWIRVNISLWLRMMREWSWCPSACRCRPTSSASSGSPELETRRRPSCGNCGLFGARFFALALRDLFGYSGALKSPESRHECAPRTSKRSWRSSCHSPVMIAKAYPRGSCRPG